MDKVIRKTEIVMMAIFLLIGAASFIGGLITGMWHCFMLTAMCVALPYVWYSEERKNKDNSYGRGRIQEIE